MSFSKLSAPALSMVREHVATWSGDLWVGCSGDFAIERALAELGRPMHSNDVHLYPAVLGGYLAGAPLTLSFSSVATNEFPWLTDDILGESPERDAAIVMLCSDLAPHVGRQHPVSERIVAGFAAQWDTLVDTTTAKIVDVAGGLKLTSYRTADVHTWASKLPGDAPTILHATIGADDVKLNSLFTWEPPPYEPITVESLPGLIDAVTARDHWLLATTEPVDEHVDASTLRGRFQKTNRGRPLTVYASAPPRRIVAPHQATAPVLIPKLSDTDTLRRDAAVTIVALSGAELNHLRSVYLNRNIAPAGSENYGAACGVVVDGMLVGAFALTAYASLAGTGWNGKLTGPTIYLLTDFPVAPTAYKRLSKLIVMAATSREAARVVERLVNRRFYTIGTHAFTKRQSSMKYRGILDLVHRSDRPPDTDGTPNFALAYGGPFGARPLADLYIEWFDRYSTDEPDEPKPARRRRKKPTP